ncbi:hypothetical protein [Actinomadura verrucosospora]|uniref:Uncharacterized protein n=1 Tax=Actinomadura verrucosospora TaxID=46165 RepID=A0A7D4A402_ACTVE|nr:hypothetical protein [Actinomadura verrucosospora]QKG19867.1 hypothetical protein ACTIVE_1503 [Actinomadura verrucosospora]
MSGTLPDVWISAADGDLIRADAIVILRLDRTGRLTVQLRDEAKVSVTLLEGSSTGGHPPADFHRQLIRMIAEVAASGSAQVIGARHVDGGWRWISEPL